jgi:hypothetical protein
MIRETPPQWLERMLLFFLPARDRETISGDLLEEYREERLPRLGPIRANLWYLRQSISFASIRIPGGPHVKQLLISVSVFTVVAGVWLAFMENVLKHSGYSLRSAIAVGIAVQSLATLLCVVVDGRAIFRAIVLTGAVGIGLLGARSVGRILRAEHFEGFVLLIGLALMLQGVLTFLVLLQPRHGKTA